MDQTRACGAGPSRMAALFLGAALVVGLLLAPGSASAQERKSKRVITLDAITVEGRIQKPQAIYILQRSILSFGELDRAESFVPKVIKSVDKDPF